MSIECYETRKGAPAQSPSKWKVYLWNTRGGLANSLQASSGGWSEEHLLAGWKR